jgi:diguanylate cyclase (GGDEF)-like protein
MLQQHATVEMPHADDLREAARLEAVDALDVLDTPREEGLDGIARLVRNIFRVPVGIVSVIDGHRQWYKAVEGLSTAEIARRDAFCDTVIATGRPLVIQDAKADARFALNPQVVGEPHIRFYAGVPLRTRAGHDIGTLCAMDFQPRSFGAEQVDILTDLARVAMAEFELRQLVSEDAMTGVLSRRAFKDEGNRAMALARRHEMDTSALVFDIDLLKDINAEHGAAVGDQVLAAVADACRNMLRRTDHIGRISGNTFGVVLPHTAQRGAMDAAEKLRATVERLEIETDAGILKVTVSFGVAGMDTETEDLDALLARADLALHEAKQAGRNSCKLWRAGDSGRRPATRRVLKAGLIHFNGGRSTIDCTVRTLSEDGAGLDLSSSYGLPDRFGLLIRSDGADRSCLVVKQSERHAEVEFL